MYACKQSGPCCLKTKKTKREKSRTWNGDIPSTRSVVAINTQRISYKHLHWLITLTVKIYDIIGSINQQTISKYFSLTSHFGTAVTFMRSPHTLPFAIKASSSTPTSFPSRNNCFPATHTLVTTFVPTYTSALCTSNIGVLRK
jgi:hypothetical protein